MALLKIILFIVAFYYLFKAIFRIAGPMLLGKLLQKMNNQQGAAYKQTDNNSKEGEVKVKKTKAATKRASEDMGEYVSFEEIKE